MQTSIWGADVQAVLDLNDQEVLIVANADTQAGWTGEVIVDVSLNPTGEVYEIVYSNKKQPAAPGAVVEKSAGSVVVTEVDGSVTHGPI
jgi:hypothetical protein